ncbi:MAG: hypothetical protein H6735_01245 [Alphaproteobacteria bacterium]|nr:hypothetical protein [Alphaproteobacteria bacterium]
MGADDDHPPAAAKPRTGTYDPFAEEEASDELPASVLDELTDEAVDGLLQNLASGLGTERMDPEPTPPTTLAKTWPAETDDGPETPPTPQVRASRPPRPEARSPVPHPAAERVPDLLDLFATPLHPTPEREFPRVAALAPEPDLGVPTAPALPPGAPPSPEAPLAPPAPPSLFARLFAMIRGLFA